jgi:hypothetical protein
MRTMLCESLACMGHGDAGKQQSRQAVSSLRLCRECRRKVRSELVGLPALHKDCERVLTRRRQGYLKKVSGRRLNGICLDEAAVTVRSDIVRVLASWSGLVVGERGVTGPDKREVVQLAGFLDLHLDWLVAHPAAHDFAGEIATLATAARDVIDPGPAFRMELGRCEESGCGRTMYATIGAEDESLRHKVICEAGHVWQPQQWLLLGRRMEQVGSGLLRERAESAERAV